MSSRSSLRLLVLGLALSSLAGCSFHSTARAWNGLVGADGEPVFYTSTTKVGAKLLVVIPLFGNLDIDGMVAELTSEISAAGGDHVRIVQGASENYWYGFPPLTWIITPVISRVDADWRPTGAEFALHRSEWLDGKGRHEDAEDADEAREAADDAHDDVGDDEDDSDDSGDDDDSDDDDGGDGGGEGDQP